jgi:hypothetical protein
MTANEGISKLHFYHNIVAKKCTTVTVYSPFIYLFEHQVTIILFISSFKHYKIPLFSQYHFLVSLHELYELNHTHTHTYFKTSQMIFINSYP